MKWLYSSLLSLFFISTVAHSQEAVTPFNWNLFGFTKDGTDGYIDTNIKIIEVTNSRVIESVNILLIFPSPMTVITPKGPMEITSVIARAIVDCKKGMIMPFLLYSFDVGVPTKDTHAIGKFTYNPETTKPIMFDFQKTDSTYKLLCPIYV